MKGHGHTVPPWRGLHIILRTKKATVGTARPKFSRSTIPPIRNADNISLIDAADVDRLLGSFSSCDLSFLHFFLLLVAVSATSQPMIQQLPGCRFLASQLLTTLAGSLAWVMGSWLAVGKQQASKQPVNVTMLCHQRNVLIYYSSSHELQLQ